ncbi:MAG: hypothetical protein OXC44_02845 [Proteobacteria bacterium]|nr:hypothetical protein [Pseudomonadota bacterium]
MALLVVGCAGSPATEDKHALLASTQVDTRNYTLMLWKVGDNYTFYNCEINTVLTDNNSIAGFVQPAQSYQQREVPSMSIGNDVPGNCSPAFKTPNGDMATFAISNDFERHRIKRELSKKNVNIVGVEDVKKEKMAFDNTVVGTLMLLAVYVLPDAFPSLFMASSRVGQKAVQLLVFIGRFGIIMFNSRPVVSATHQGRTQRKKAAKLFHWNKLDKLDKSREADSSMKFVNTFSQKELGQVAHLLAKQTSFVDMPTTYCFPDGAGSSVCKPLSL